MIRLGKGVAIVNVSSQAAMVALPGHISYGASKGALENITKVAALELGKHRIRVNSVNPTVVMTEMSAWYCTGNSSCIPLNLQMFWRRIFAEISRFRGIPCFFPVTGNFEPC
jgi:NAD(P)-dependent dehydrogenase (short-subunit alcohol dehydrogenase family)